MRRSRFLVLAGAFVLAMFVAVPGWGSSTGSVASGSFGAFAWRLSATDSADGHVCLTMTLAHHVGDSSSECGSIFGPEAGKADGITYLAHTGAPAPDYLVGPVDARAKVVVIALSTGRTIKTNAVAPPKRMTAKIAFYVAQLPCPARPISVRGLDANSRVVAHLAIPHLSVRGKSAC